VAVNYLDLTKLLRLNVKGWCEWDDLLGVALQKSKYTQMKETYTDVLWQVFRKYIKLHAVQVVRFVPGRPRCLLDAIGICSRSLFTGFSRCIWLWTPRRSRFSLGSKICNR